MAVIFTNEDHGDDDDVDDDEGEKRFALSSSGLSESMRDD